MHPETLRPRILWNVGGILDDRHYGPRKIVVCKARVNVSVNEGIKHPGQLENTWGLVSVEQAIKQGISVVTEITKISQISSRINGG